MAETKLIPISKIKPNTGQIPDVKANPRCIKDEKYRKLRKSLEDNPEMLELRELLVYEYDGHFICIGGNMRYRVCKELGYKELPCKVIPPTATPEQLNAYIIKDNSGFGEWDWDMLCNEWDTDLLEDWGVDFVWKDDEGNDESEDRYTAKIVSPIYEPKNDLPNLGECIDRSKFDELMSAINAHKELDSDVRDFLALAAHRHVVFNYEKIADYYANAPQDVQELMEDSALVIIDFDKAIEGGFVKATEWIKQMWDKDPGKNQIGDDDEE